MQGIPGCSADPYFVSLQLWTFIGENLDNALFDKRTEKAGEEENGIELWRKLFVTHEGGSRQVQVSGIGSLHSFPACDKTDDLNDWLEMWNKCRLRYGSYLPDEHLKVMLEEKLPVSVAKDLREQRHLHTLDQCLDYLWGEITRLNDVKIANLHSTRLKQMLSKRSVSAVVEDSTHEHTGNMTPETSMTMLTAQVNQLSKTVAAAMNPRPKAKPKPAPKSGANKSKLPTPDPKFEGCWHCKGQGHSRRQCPDFKALLKANGGKLPDGYEGEYEKWCKRNGKHVAAILDADGESDAESEWSESDLGICAAMCCMPCDLSDEIPTSNSFKALEEESDDEDEAKVVAALHAISRSITVGKKPPQKQRKAQRSPDPVTKGKLMSIVASLKDGSMTFPEITDDCKTDEEFEYVWALMDSGSFVNIANHEKHFPRAKLRPSALQKQGVKCAAANGSEIQMKEEMVVRAYTDNGDRAQVTFQNGDVHLPILSVARLSDHHDALFHDSGGVLTHRKSKRKTNFVKKDGVYFIRLKVPTGKRRNDDPNMADFHRPGN